MYNRSEKNEITPILLGEALELLKQQENSRPRNAEVLKLHHSTKEYVKRVDPVQDISKLRRMKECLKLEGLSLKEICVVGSLGITEKDHLTKILPSMERFNEFELARIVETVKTAVEKK